MKQESKLKSARNWGFIDMFGGGISTADYTMQESKR